VSKIIMFLQIVVFDLAEVEFILPVAAFIVLCGS